MPEQNLSRVSEFSGKRTVVYFIYSFNLKDGENYNVLHEKLANKYKQIKEGTPTYRKGITPHLTFNPDSAYLEYPRAYKAQVSYYRNINPPSRKVKRTLDVTINRLTRFFRTGCTCTISVELLSGKDKNNAERYDKEDILSILNLVAYRERNTRSEGSELVLQPSGKSERLYNIFYETVKELTTKLKINWLADDCDLTDCKKEVQSPWVVTMVEVDGCVAEAFCEPCGLGDDPAKSKMLKMRKYQHDIAPILYRSVSPDGLYIEPAYLDPPSPSGIPGIFSENIDARLFVGISRRSILCLCKDCSEDPAKYFIPGLLDVCEIIRTRWHMLILMNKVVDKTIRGITSDITSDSKPKKSDYRKSSYDIVKQFLYLRQWLSNALEDPGIYTVSGDALIKIYRDMEKGFRIGELREMVLGKLNLLDRVFEDREEYEYLEKRPTSRQAKYFSKK